MFKFSQAQDSWQDFLQNLFNFLRLYRDDPQKLEENNQINKHIARKNELIPVINEIKELLPRLFLNQELHKDNIANAENQLETGNNELRNIEISITPMRSP